MEMRPDGRSCCEFSVCRFTVVKKAFLTKMFRWIYCLASCINPPLLLLPCSPHCSSRGQWRITLRPFCPSQRPFGELSLGRVQVGRRGICQNPGCSCQSSITPPVWSCEVACCSDTLGESRDISTKMIL